MPKDDLLGPRSEGLERPRTLSCRLRWRQWRRRVSGRTTTSRPTAGSGNSSTRNRPRGWRRRALPGAVGGARTQSRAAAPRKPATGLPLGRPPPKRCCSASTRVRASPPRSWCGTSRPSGRAAKQLVGLVRGGVALGPRELEAEFDELEQELPFNCEHVVPQSWFAKREPMRGDLHHLFACESRCNSFRGNWPYFDFEERERTVREHCGRLEAEGFQPRPAKDPLPAPRSTSCCATHASWETRSASSRPRGPSCSWPSAQDDPVSDYERHRNAAIAERQARLLRRLGVTPTTATLHPRSSDPRNLLRASRPAPPPPLRRGAGRPRP